MLVGFHRTARDSIHALFQPTAAPDRPREEMLTVHDPRFYDRVRHHGTLGLGESYMDGWWDCPRLDRFFEAALNAGLLEEARYTPDAVWSRLRQRLVNEQSPGRAHVVADRHYDLGNDLFGAFLDSYRQYSCGYFKETDSLEVAQQQKLDLICRKLELRAGDRLLDIGCGWGGLAKYAAEHYGCHVVGVSISEPQVQYARKFCAGLPVEIRNCDYRDVGETFDKIVSVGMFEHVGYKNYRTMMHVAHRRLKRDGLFLLHTIGKGSDAIPIGDPWLLKYIFPGGMIPTPRRVADAIEGLFDPVDLHEFGAYYDPTLMRWTANFDREWPMLCSQYDERFHRMWRYYLLSCAALFRVRKLHLWQWVLRPAGGPAYASIR